MPACGVDLPGVVPAAARQGGALPARDMLSPLLSRPLPVPAALPDPGDPTHAPTGVWRGRLDVVVCSVVHGRVPHALHSCFVTLLLCCPAGAVSPHQAARPRQHAYCRLPGPRPRGPNLRHDPQCRAAPQGRRVFLCTLSSQFFSLGAQDTLLV